MEKDKFCACNANKEGGACMAEIMVTIPLELYDRLRDDSLLLQKIRTYQENEEYSDRTINAILGIVKKDDGDE